MPHSSRAASYSDAALLLGVQVGDHAVGEPFYRRFTPRVIGMIRALRPECRCDFRDDVHGEVFRMLVDSNVERFTSARGSLVQYVFGLVKNAIKIIERQRRPAVIGRRVKPVSDEIQRSPRDAATVYDQTIGSRSEPVLDTTFVERELVEVVMKNTDEMTAKIAYLRYVEELPATVIAKTLRIDRFVVARRLTRFRCEAAECLALVGVA